MARKGPIFVFSLIILFLSWAYNVTVSVHTEVEIAAPPTKVREVVLDFPNWTEWHSSMIQRIETVDGKPAKDLKKGDFIVADIGEAAKNFKATVMRNDAEEFRWYGANMAGAFAGEHFFRFEKSKSRKGGTTFVHGEDYTGWIRWIFKLPGMGQFVYDLFNGLTIDVERRIEELKILGKL